MHRGAAHANARIARGLAGMQENHDPRTCSAMPCGSSPISADTAPASMIGIPDIRSCGTSDKAGKRGDGPPDRLQGRPKARLREDGNAVAMHNLS